MYPFRVHYLKWISASIAPFALGRSQGFIRNHSVPHVLHTCVNRSGSFLVWVKSRYQVDKQVNY